MRASRISLEVCTPCRRRSRPDDRSVDAPRRNPHRQPRRAADESAFPQSLLPPRYRAGTRCRITLPWRINPLQVPWELRLRRPPHRHVRPPFLALPIGLLALRRRRGDCSGRLRTARAAMADQHRRALPYAGRCARRPGSRHGVAPARSLGGNRLAGGPMLAAGAGRLGDALQFPPPRVPARRRRGRGNRSRLL